MQFSHLVRSARLEQGLLIRELALLAKVNPCYISLVEHGHKNPRIGNAIRIARALGIDIGMLELVDEKFIAHGFVKARNERTRKGKRKTVA